MNVLRTKRDLGLSVILATTQLLAATAALACPRTEKQLICPGDTVYPSDFVAGYAKVLAVNPWDQTISVSGSNSQRNYTYSAGEVALGAGCLYSICVADTVYPSDFTAGYATVVGVNPQKQTVVVRGSNSGTKLYNYRVSDIAQGIGCYKGYCVGDKVVPKDFVSGFGTIRGINFFTGNISVYGNNSGSKLFTYPVTSLASSGYCSTYSDAHRTVPAYPDRATFTYSITKWNFSVTRPY